MAHCYINLDWELDYYDYDCGLESAADLLTCFSSYIPFFSSKESISSIFASFCSSYSYFSRRPSISWFFRSISSLNTLITKSLEASMFYKYPASALKQLCEFFYVSSLKILIPHLLQVYVPSHSSYSCAIISILIIFLWQYMHGTSILGHAA